MIKKKIKIRKWARANDQEYTMKFTKKKSENEYDFIQMHLFQRMKRSSMCLQNCFVYSRAGCIYICSNTNAASNDHSLIESKNSDSIFYVPVFSACVWFIWIEQLARNRFKKKNIQCLWWNSIGSFQWQ